MLVLLTEEKIGREEWEVKARSAEGSRGGL